MGLFDAIAGQVVNSLSSSSDSAQGGMMDAVLGLLGNNTERGGLASLISAFQENGLGDTVASWISTGQNLPISSEQLQAVLGNEQVQAIAQKLGLSAEDASSGLANLLPQVIDKLTPDGQVPESGLLEQGLALLKGFGNNA